MKDISLVMYNAAVADTNGTALPCEGLATACVQLSGTITSATIYFEGTVDNSNWIGILGWNRNTGVKALTATAAGLYVFDVTGLSQFRARLDWTTGSVNAVANGSPIPTTTLVTAS